MRGELEISEALWTFRATSLFCPLALSADRLYYHNNACWWVKVVQPVFCHRSRV